MLPLFLPLDNQGKKNNEGVFGDTKAETETKEMIGFYRKGNKVLAKLTNN